MLDILKIKTRDQHTDKIKLYYHCVRNLFQNMRHYSEFDWTH